MDECSHRRSVGGFSFSKRGSSLSFREPNNEERTLPYCNRLGCSTRFNSMKDPQIGNPEKSKYPKTSFHSMSSKSVGESSTKSFAAASINLRKSHKQQLNRAPQQDKEQVKCSKETEEIKSSSQLGDAEDSEDIESLASQRSSAVSTASSSDSKSRKQVSRRVGSCTRDIPSSSSSLSSSSQRSSTVSTASSSDSKSHKQVSRRVGSYTRDIPSSSSSSLSSVRRPITDKSIGQVTKPSSQYLGSGPPRYGIKNLSCSSISDALPSGCSSSDPGQSRRVVSERKRPINGESSSSGAKGANGSSSGSLMLQQAPRRAKNRPLSKDVPVSVRTRRYPNGETRTVLPDQQDDNMISVSEPVAYPQLPRSQLTIHEIVRENPSRSLPSSFGGRVNSSGRNARSRLISSHPGDGSARGSLGDREGYRRFNMDGIAEVLLALESIEQDDELTYEQLLVLGTNLFVGGLSLHDQHRDMRLDIDNMTYEELLALEEEMGTVSTALSEEALSKCLKRSSYLPVCESPGINARGDDDVKCSICQEEYVMRDEVGKLACNHRYHVDCICQWLRQKNWCPICKTAAASTQAQEAKE